MRERAGALRKPRLLLLLPLFIEVSGETVRKGSEEPAV
jgi:hypothetical protein